MTDEEMEKYVDEHWKCVVYCRECKHQRWDEVPYNCSISVCSRLDIRTTPNFFCADGEKK